jgi:hypothetical protein
VDRIECSLDHVARHPVAGFIGKRQGRFQMFDHPILWRYQQEFDAYLGRPGARLMVIGYGYNDSHINDAIGRAVERGLKLFIVDPLGMEVLMHDVTRVIEKGIIERIGNT